MTSLLVHISICVLLLSLACSCQGGKPASIDELVAEHLAKCRFECAPGQQMRARAGHVPSSNGCGSSSVKFEPSHSFLEDCCHVHDECYDRCGTGKLKCDDEFKRCLDSQCVDKLDGGEANPEHAVCKQSAGLMSLGVRFGGCDSFIKAQENACECVAPPDKDEL
jgi:secretory phospholipase A2